MTRRKEIFILLVTDLLMIWGAWVTYYLIRVNSGLVPVPIEPDVIVPMVVMYLFWLLVFFVAGLYRSWYAASRLDELVLLTSAVSVGCLILFFVVFFDDAGAPDVPAARAIIVMYWVILLAYTGMGRLAVHSIQRRLIIAGIGTRTTIIVGGSIRARTLWEDVRRYPALGYRVVGYVTLERRKGAREVPDLPLLGTLRSLEGIIRKLSVQEVLIALDSRDHEKLLGIVATCGNVNVGIKILPDMYDIISGQAKTNQIYGFPLIDISPQLMTPWEESTKRLIDVLVAGTVLVAGFPLWVLVGVAVYLDSPGGVFYRQDRVGMDGIRFSMVKFRSMFADAEKSGPQWANKRDPRVTRVGRVLRRLHLDEIPQLWNILRGDMSLVGPRPERPVFVEKLAKEIPLYRRRLKVRPGVTGWAQVKHKYDESIDDVRKKVQYDLFYIENMSLRMDFKIILSTFSHMLMGKGH